VARFGLTAPAQQELLRGGPAARHDLVRHHVRLPVGDAGRAGGDRHHLRGEPAEVLPRLLVGDLVQLAELPLAGEAARLGLQVGRRVTRQRGRLIRFRVGHRRTEVVVDEQSPDVLVRIVADELLDVDASIPEGAALAVGLRDLGLDGDDALESWPEVVHATRMYPRSAAHGGGLPPPRAPATARRACSSRRSRTVSDTLATAAGAHEKEGHQQGLCASERAASS
jgi:hypothetical protein